MTHEQNHRAVSRLTYMISGEANPTGGIDIQPEENIRAGDLEPDPDFDPLKEAELCRRKRIAPLFCFGATA